MLDLHLPRHYPFQGVVEPPLQLPSLSDHPQPPCASSNPLSNRSPTSLLHPQPSCGKFDGNARIPGHSSSTALPSHPSPPSTPSTFAPASSHPAHGAMNASYQGFDHAFPSAPERPSFMPPSSTHGSHTRPSPPLPAHMSYPYQNYQPPSQPPSRPRSTQSHVASPVFPHDPNPSMQQASERASKSITHVNGGIHPYLQLPSTIGSNKSSLAEFAAQITCLFWFESSATLDRIEDAALSRWPRTPLGPDAVPSTGFLKWVTTILSTTQVTQNVILLALLFIHRLKKQNPNVKGKPGSEYRLLTVALMLGNKFLDDNTYTNKTWAEVSGISVTEIHVMEVEFLSHMKYNLYTPKEEWTRWHAQLQHLWRYFNQPVAEYGNVAARPNSLRPPNLRIPTHLPSPPASTSISPPYTVSTSPGLGPYHQPYGSYPQLPPPQASPSSSLIPDYDHAMAHRKRNVVDPVPEPPAKRPHLYDPHPTARGYAQNVQPPPAASFGRQSTLQMPHLPLPASQPVQNQNMSSTLTPISSSRTPQQPLPPFKWVDPSSSSSPFAMPQQNVQLGIPEVVERTSRRHTPYHTATPTNLSPGPSTIPSAAAHTASQNQLSPSFFLTQRHSPYKPVRRINTLLVPPSSDQMHHVPQEVSYEQMRWQPLGKPTNERRTGRVPYLHREAWPSTYQVDQWPPSLFPGDMQGGY